MPCLDPEMQQEGVLMNKTAEIQGFVEANMLETHFRAGGGGRGVYYTREYVLSRSQEAL